MRWHKLQYKTSEQSTESAKMAVQGQQQVDETVKAIRDMNQDVALTSDLIQGLAVQSQDIGKVLDVIRAIAEQTNLLALNAAIEAARAGCWSWFCCSSRRSTGTGASYSNFNP